MRIDGYGQIGSTRAKTKAKGSGKAGASFSVGKGGGASNTSAAAGPSSVQHAMTLDSLLALQGAFEEPSSRQQAMSVGRAMLDDLAELQASVLGGDSGTAALMRLKDQLQDRTPTGEEKLDLILREINLRARVELAKRA